MAQHCYGQLFWMPRVVPTQKASPSSGKHGNGMCPLPDVLQQASHNELQVHFYQKQQTMTLTPALHKQSSYKALQPEQDN